MNLKGTQLKQIVKEELAALLQEGGRGTDPLYYNADSGKMHPHATLAPTHNQEEFRQEGYLIHLQDELDRLLKNPQISTNVSLLEDIVEIIKDEMNSKKERPFS